MDAFNFDCSYANFGSELGNNMEKPEYFFTADTHFGHANIIRYTKRPWLKSGDVNENNQWVSRQIAADRCFEMDEELIKRWNSVVRPIDYVYHLGDFCFRDFDTYFHRLNGIITFVEGNHDKAARQSKHKFHSYHNLLETIVNSTAIVMCHYAMKVWNKSHRGAWHLYGHSHGTLPDDPNSLSIDVGVDCNNYYPMHFDQVSRIMKTKTFKPIDHHGA